MNKIWALLLILELSTAPLFSRSLWHTQGISQGTLFTDQKGRGVGDIVTIIISESSSASKKATTSTEKKTSVDGGITTLLYANSGAGKHKGTLPAMKWETNNSFEGGGEISNEESLSLKIASLVIDTYPNGTLLLEGKRQIIVDRETKVILVTGIARSKDVTADNTILSENIANFHVRYEGDGPLGQNQRRGFLTKIFDMFSIL